MKKTKVPMMVKGLLNIKEDMNQKIEDCENEVISKVLKGLLHRDPTEDDYKACIRAIEKGVEDKYNLIFAGVNLGQVAKEVKSNECLVSFVPDDKFNSTN